MSGCCKDSKDACKAQTECQKVDGKTCKMTKICKIQTPDGEADCECVCTCICESGNCSKCDCKCNCSYENAKKIQTPDGVKYRCECTCKC